jgi:hypothetical protein
MKESFAAAYHRWLWMLTHAEGTSTSRINAWSLMVYAQWASGRPDPLSNAWKIVSKAGVAAVSRTADAASRGE